MTNKMPVLVLTLMLLLARDPDGVGGTQVVLQWTNHSQVSELWTNESPVMVM